MKFPVESTYCSDPAAKFTVSSLGPDCAGIQGYFTNELAAHRVAKYLKSINHTKVTVDPYDPTATTTGSIHPLVLEFTGLKS